MYAGHLDFAHPLIRTLDDALPPALCAAYVARIEDAAEPEQAPIVGKDLRPAIELETRNNTRVMWDDPAEAESLLARVRDQVPATFHEQRLHGANPRLRLYRYAPGQKHGVHWDTEVELPGGVRSRMTLVFYLDHDFEGGQTDFPELDERIEPRAGRALIFQHRVLHSAMPVTRGVKHVLRTDILYR